MKGRLFRGIALPVFIVSPAMAADLPLKAPPAPVQAAAASWTGFYVGANAGYAWGQNATSCSFVPSVGNPCEGIAFPDLKSRGGLLGVEAGANWQHQNWVLGAAFDWSAMDLHASEYFPSVDSGKSDEVATRYDWLGTARGRVGYAVGQSLFYGTGGLAIGRVKDTYFNEINTSSAGYFSTDGTRTGWTAGAGWEYRIARNWDLKVEYLHVDLGRSTLDISAAKTSGNGQTGGPPGSAALQFNNAFDLVRAGVSYKW